MTRRAADVCAALVRKGFVRAEGKHAFFIYHSEAGVKSAVQTMVSHGAREIPDPFLSAMARQCRLSRADFLRLVDCPLSRAEYESRLRSSGALP